MARRQQIRCAQCGAKNEHDTLRCRICSSLLPASRPENRGPDRLRDLPLSPARPAPARPPDPGGPAFVGPGAYDGRPEPSPFRPGADTSFSGPVPEPTGSGRPAGPADPDGIGGLPPLAGNGSASGPPRTDPVEQRRQRRPGVRPVNEPFADDLFSPHQFETQRPPGPQPADDWAPDRPAGFPPTMPTPAARPPGPSGAAVDDWDAPPPWTPAPGGPANGPDSRPHARPEPWDIPPGPAAPPREAYPAPGQPPAWDAARTRPPSNGNGMAPPPARPRPPEPSPWDGPAPSAPPRRPERPQWDTPAPGATPNGSTPWGNPEPSAPARPEPTQWGSPGPGAAPHEPNPWDGPAPSAPPRRPDPTQRDTRGAAPRAPEPTRWDAPAPTGPNPPAWTPEHPWPAADRNGGDRRDEYGAPPGYETDPFARPDPGRPDRGADPFAPDETTATDFGGWDQPGGTPRSPRRGDDPFRGRPTRPRWDDPVGARPPGAPPATPSRPGGPDAGGERPEPRPDDQWRYPDRTGPEASSRPAGPAGSRPFPGGPDDPYFDDPGDRYRSAGGRYDGDSTYDNGRGFDPVGPGPGPIPGARPRPVPGAGPGAMPGAGPMAGGRPRGQGRRPGTGADGPAGRPNGPATRPTDPTSFANEPGAGRPPYDYGSRPPAGPGRPLAGDPEVINLTDRAGGITGGPVIDVRGTAATPTVDAARASVLTATRTAPVDAPPGRPQAPETAADDEPAPRSGRARLVFIGVVGVVVIALGLYQLFFSSPSVQVNQGSSPSTDANSADSAAANSTNQPADDATSTGITGDNTGNSAANGRPESNPATPQTRLFSDPNGHFQVQLPGQPAQQNQVYPTPIGELTVPMWTAGDGNLEESVAVVERPDLDLPTAATQAANDYAQQLGSTPLAGQLSTDAGGHTVYQFEVQTSAYYALVEMVFTPQRYFVLMTRSASGPADAAHEALINSFKVTDPPASS